MFTQATEHPTTITLLAAGLITFFGLMGLGRIVCRLARVGSRDPWKTVLASLTGVLVASLLVEVAAIAFRPRSAFWIAGWWSLAAIGLWQVTSLVCAVRWSGLRAGLRDPFIAVAVAADVVTLLIALAPSSKIDELYYHMLAPQRVLADGGLHFYLFPWESAILPQMHYQLSQVLLHAIGLADAANVVSWCFSMLLQVFVARLTIARGQPVRVGTFAAACLSVGMIPAVWHVTAGAHAVGHLASAALIIFAAPGGSRESGLAGRNAIIGAALLAVAAASTKLTLLPLTLVCLAWVALHEWRTTGGTLRQFIRLSCFAILPWLIFYVPLAAFTAYHSGSPFALVMQGSTGPSLYAPGEGEEILRTTKSVNQAGPEAFVFQSGTGHSPIVWLAAAALLVTPTGTGLRWYWRVITGLELVVITFITQNDLRFMAGYPSAALALFLMNCGSEVRRWTGEHRRLAVALATIGLVPWLLGMLWYARPFAECSLGIQSREQFMEVRTTLRRDFLALDKLLPRNVVFLVHGRRLNSVNAPRPVIYDVRDLPANRPVFLISIDDPAPQIAGATIGEAIYENTSAVTSAYRRPGATPRRGTIHVFPMSVRGR